MKTNIIKNGIEIGQITQGVKNKYGVWGFEATRYETNETRWCMSQADADYFVRIGFVPQNTSGISG